MKKREKHQNPPGTLNFKRENMIIDVGKLILLILVRVVEYELSDLFKKAIPDFDYYGVTRVSLKQWKKILKICVNKRHKSVCVINDMKDWVNECFKSFDCFTICGL